jgi:hypothetical protein
MKRRNKMNTYLVKRRDEATPVDDLQIASASNELLHGSDGVGINAATAALDQGRLVVGECCDSKERKDDGGELHGEWKMLSMEKMEMEATGRWRRE